jgi:predicted NUDIX family NTP pyrophosphohydrolase
MVQIVVSLLLVREGELLATKTAEGRWSLPAETVLESEEIETALARLVRRTLTLPLSGEQFVDTVYEYDAGGTRIVRNLYRAAIDGELSTPELIGEHAEFCWMSSMDLFEAGVSEAIIAAAFEDVLSPAC